jgi:glycosyltransferase involved in cell wall biosynthesis
MNILIINSAKEWGGTEKWAIYTAMGLSKMGHTVYFGCRDTLFDERFNDGNVKIVKFPFANNMDVFTIWKLFWFMKKYKIDVVMPSKQREYFLAGLAARMLPKVKVAGLYGIDRPIHNLRNWIVFCRLFHIVFVNAKKIIDVLGGTKAFDVAKCKLVYVGVERIECLESVRKYARKDLGIAENEICIMGIGRIAPQKGFDYAIEALAKLNETVKNVKLVLIGDGDIEYYRNIAVKLGVENKVVFAGFKDNISELVQAMDIFWLTSRSEGIPNTMLEAMAVKKPVITFDIAGVAEIIKDNENGILVPFENVDILVEKTLILLNDSQLSSQLARAGYQTVKEYYSMEKMCQDIDSVLKEIKR